MKSVHHYKACCFVTRSYCYSHRVGHLDKILITYLQFGHDVLEHLTKDQDFSRLKMARSSQVQSPPSQPPNVASEFLRAQSDRNTTLGEGK